jgi:hypothetical protein
MFICTAPPGHKKNFRCAMLVNFRSATHIYKNGNCTSVSGTLEVQRTSGAALEASSLVGAFLILIVSLDFSAPRVCPIAVQFPLCFYFL